MKIALIANPGSGSSDPDEVERQLRSEGAEVERFELDQAERAAAAGADRLVVAGGDGSVGPAAAAAFQAAAPLAVVAAGTANDFARRMGIARDVREACHVAVHGRRLRELELGHMDARPFVNVASLGLPAPAARRASAWKRALGPLAYAAGAISAGLSARPVPCRVEADGRLVHDGPVWQLTVACTGAFGAGSQIEEADPADGALDLVLVEAGSRLHLPALAWGLRRGGLTQQRGVRHLRAADVRVETPAGTAYNVDGEVVEYGPAGPARFTAQARAFRLVVG